MKKNIHATRKGLNVAEAQVEIKEGGNSKLLIISVIFAVIAAGGGFYAAFSGLIPEIGKGGDKSETETAVVPLKSVAFVEVEPMLIPMGNLLSNQHLRFRAELEVEPEYQQDVEALKPRIVDVLNGYLRALDREDLEQPAALILLRSNMLRRVQTVVGEGRVNDLLIMEFVVN